MGMDARALEDKTGGGDTVVLLLKNKIDSQNQQYKPN